MYPVSPVEIVPRVNAVLRRANRSDTQAWPRLLDFGSLVIDPDAREVWVNGNQVDLTAREFDLLHHLARHPRRVFSRDALFESMWGDFGDRRTVTVHISRLREKIERDSAHPEYIATVRGIGYRFEGVPV